MYRISNKPRFKQTAKPSKYPQGYFKSKSCRLCAASFKPSAPSHHYCSEECRCEGHMTAYLNRVYGITYQDYLRMHRAQRGLCKLCRCKGFKMAEHHNLLLVVDHCHKTGRVRGLLCHNCNRALGLFKDNAKVMRKAYEYVKV